MNPIQYLIQYAIVGGFLTILLVPLWLPILCLWLAVRSLRRHIDEGRWR